MLSTYMSAEKAEQKIEEKPPENPKLVEAERAFEAGDYQLLRKLCDEVIAAGPPEAAEAARALRRRTEVDRVQLAILGACLVLFVIIAYIYVA